MSSQGPNNCGTGANGSGGVAWVNPNNVAVVSQQASISLSAGQLSDFLNVTNFSFSVPTGVNVIINGVSFSLSVGSSGGVVIDNAVFLLIGGSQVGSNQATGATWTGTRTYGGSSNLMGASPTPSNVNAVGFGIAAQVKNTGATSQTGLVLAFVTATVYYTMSPTQFFTVLSGVDS